MKEHHCLTRDKPETSNNSTVNFLGVEGIFMEEKDIQDYKGKVKVNRPPEHHMNHGHHLSTRTVTTHPEYEKYKYCMFCSLSTRAEQ